MTVNSDLVATFHYNRFIRGGMLRPEPSKACRLIFCRRPLALLPHRAIPSPDRQWAHRLRCREILLAACHARGPIEAKGNLQSDR